MHTDIHRQLILVNTSTSMVLGSVKTPEDTHMDMGKTCIETPHSQQSKVRINQEEWSCEAVTLLAVPVNTFLKIHLQNLFMPFH